MCYKCKKSYHKKCSGKRFYKLTPHKPPPTQKQIRSSRPEVDPSELTVLCDNLAAAVSRVCHRTNQWYLLRDLLATRVCSPYLLPESASEAWVDEVVSKHDRPKENRELFRGQEFMCDLQWKRHITPHWRLMDKGECVYVVQDCSCACACIHGHNYNLKNRHAVYIRIQYSCIHTCIQ